MGVLVCVLVVVRMGVCVCPGKIEKERELQRESLENKSKRGCAPNEAIEGAGGRLLRFI